MTADRLLGSSIVEAKGFSSLSALSEKDRHRLLVAVVRLCGATGQWKALYGTTLNPDERFCAIAVEVWRKERSETVNRLRGARKRLMESASPSISTTLQDSALKGIDSINGSLAAFNSLNGLSKTIALPTNLGLKGFGLGDQSVSKALSASSRSVLTEGGLASIKPPVVGLLDQSLKPGLLTALRTSLGIDEPGRIAFLDGIAASTAAGTAKPASLLASEGLAHLVGSGSLGKVSELLNSAILPLTPMRGDLFEQFRGQVQRGAFRDMLPRQKISGFDGLTGAAAYIGGFGSAFPTKDFLGGFADQWRQSLNALILAEFSRKWAEDPLWFLIREMSPMEVPELIGKEPAEVHEAVLQALEEVLRTSPLPAAVEAAIKQLPFLNDEQRGWLIHGVEHARKGDWLQAVPPLILGFEGALHAAAVDAKAIASRSGKLLPAEKIIKAIELGEVYEAFAIRLVFGGRGNAFRHGRPETPSRDQTLLALVAIIGWIDAVLGTRGTKKLAEETHEPLKKALAAPVAYAEVAAG